MDPSSIAVIALAVCLFAAFSKKAERTPLTAPMFFVAVGFFLEGEGLGWIHLDVDGEAIHVLAELTLVHGLTAYPLARRYGAHCAAMQETRAEHADTPELPVRISHSANVTEGTP